jgi:type IV secretion system protein TrbL
MIAIIEPWSAIEAAQLTRSWTFLLVPLGISMVFIVLIRTIPELVQGLINGTSLATGTGLYASATGFAAGAATATVTAGMAARSGASLASEQLKDADLGGRAHAGNPIAFAGRTAANIAGAALGNVGARLSGRVPPHGTFTGQMAAEMDRRREAVRYARDKPAQSADHTETPSSPNPPSPEGTKGQGV